MACSLRLRRRARSAARRAIALALAFGVAPVALASPGPAAPSAAPAPAAPVIASPPATPSPQLNSASVEALARVGFTLVSPTDARGQPLLALVPREVLALINRAVADAQGPGAAQYAAAIITAEANAPRAPGEAGPLLRYPYLLVQVDDRDLAQATFEAIAAPLADDLRRRLPAGAEVTLDPARGAVNATHTTDAPGVGPVRTRSRGFIGTRGVVWLHLSERADAAAPTPAAASTATAFNVVLDASQFQRDIAIRGAPAGNAPPAGGAPARFPLTQPGASVSVGRIALAVVLGVVVLIGAYAIFRPRA
jgi:hypothetical protein